jgi:hypothetical protein
LTQDFHEALGLTVGPRPDFGVPWLWLYASGHAVLPVIVVTQMPAQRRGALDHMALQGDDISATLEILLSRRADAVGSCPQGEATQQACRSAA